MTSVCVACFHSSSLRGVMGKDWTQMIYVWWTGEREHAHNGHKHAQGQQGHEAETQICRYMKNSRGVTWKKYFFWGKSKIPSCSFLLCSASLCFDSTCKILIFAFQLQLFHPPIYINNIQKHRLMSYLRKLDKRESDMSQGNHNTQLKKTCLDGAYRISAPDHNGFHP